MQNKPFFSILTASLNPGASICAMIESIRSQVFHDLEHIIADGSSMDNTVDILKKYENSYNLIWWSEKDSGISGALNKCLQRARGTYFYVLGTDDFLFDDNVLSNVHDAIKDENLDIYSCPVIIDYPARGKFPCKPARFLWWHRFRNIFPHQGVFVHRRLIERVGNFSEKYSISMDYDFFYRALLTGCSVDFTNLPIALMGGTGLSSSKKYLLKRLQEEIQIQKSNERNPIWKFAQTLFWSLYIPYKTGSFTLNSNVDHSQTSCR